MQLMLLQAMLLLLLHAQEKGNSAGDLTRLALSYIETWQCRMHHSDAARAWAQNGPGMQLLVSLVAASQWQIG